MTLEIQVLTWDNGVGNISDVMIGTRKKEAVTPNFPIIAKHTIIQCNAENININI
jgi:hypothetical protein